MKKTICRVLSGCLLIVMLCMATGCGSFFSEELLQIADIEHVVLEDGQTKITITYTDETVDPDVFYIPRGIMGEVGEDGNGIKDITPTHDADNKQTVLTITFTDDSVGPQTIKIPDGVSIVGVNDYYDEITGAHTITFISSNPERYQFSPITIPRGEKGEKGNGIKDYRVEDYESEGETGKNFIFVFDDGTEQKISIPNPKGIQEIWSEEDLEQNLYKIQVLYNTGEIIPLTFPRPADPNKWYSTNEDGLSSSADLTSFFGKDGDFFFDDAHKEIWAKKDGKWIEIVSFGGNECAVNFDLNDNDEDAENRASMPKGAKFNYSIPSGTYFVANDYDIPVPTRNGYEFCGWYTKKTVNPYTMSPFTDLTTVSSDLVLYACWEKVE